MNKVSAILQDSRKVLRTAQHTNKHDNLSLSLYIYIERETYIHINNNDGNDHKILARTTSKAAALHQPPAHHRHRRLRC